MALKVGVCHSGGVQWEPWEINILEKHYGHAAGIRMVRKWLPHRNKESIRKLVAKAELTNVREWSSDAVAFLREHYGHMPVDEVAAAPGKRVCVVRNRENVLKLGKVRQTRWTREENAILTENYAQSGNFESIHVLLPHRSRKAIEAQTIKLGLRRVVMWMPAEIGVLQQFYPIRGRKVAAILSDWQTSAIHHKADKLGLRRYAKKHSIKSEQDGCSLCSCEGA